MTDEQYREIEEVESEPEAVTPGVLAQLNASEINQMALISKLRPRTNSGFRKRGYNLVVSDEDTAASCSYAIPRDGKVITGPSARFAEIIAYAWGNNRHGSRIVDEGTETVTAQGMFYDVESNVAVTCEVKVRIVDREGRRYTPDMIVTTCNAAASRADRNAVLKGIPKAAWNWVYEEAQKVVRGNVRTLTQRRDKALELFKPFGMTPAMVCQVVSVEGVSELSIEHLTTLQAILNALKDGEVTVEKLMENTQDQRVAEKGARTVDQIKAKYQKPEVKPATDEQIKRAQSKLDEKRRQSKSAEPTKASEVIEAAKAEEEQPF